MNVFEQTISQWLYSSLTKIHPEGAWNLAELARSIETPPNRELGDYAFPCFPLARIFRQKPQQIAEKLQQCLQTEVKQAKSFEQVIATGAYLNFKVSLALMAELVLPKILTGEYFEQNRKKVRSRVMIEFSQPNTHKGFHVGHCRNVALGDSLIQIFRYNGYEVVAANYIGDVGTHIAKCLWYYLEHHPEEVPTTYRGEWLGEKYTNATLKLEEADEITKGQYQKQISEILKRLEAKEPEMSQIWQRTRQWSLDELNEIYQWLNVQFDHVFYESESGRGREKISLTRRASRNFSSLSRSYWR